MLTLIRGSFGSGKSYEITQRILADLRAGHRVMLIVPEQQAVEAEGRLNSAALSSSTPVLDLEVLNFTRLADRVFRQLGGLCYNYIGKGARQLIMWRALSSLSDTLSTYRNISLSDKNTLRLMLSASDELSRCAVTPMMLADAADSIGEQTNLTSLTDKLRDLSLICSMYKALLHDQYDDPQDDLPRLAELLGEHDFFREIRVYFDSFTSFTAVQARIIRRIFAQAEEVVFSIGLPVFNGGSTLPVMYESMARTEKELKKDAAFAGLQLKTVQLEGAPRYSNGELPLLGRYLWDFSRGEPISDAAPEHIRLFSCADIFAEAEACALEITKAVRRGGRYYENVIVTREPSEYKGVIDAVFEKHGIPCFISERSDLTVKPPVKLILTAFAVINGRWRTDDVISYIKTGLTGISARECDALEEYASTWQLSGARWTDGVEWQMNPDGYSETFTQRGLDILKTVNDLRDRLTEPLSGLAERFDGSITVREACEALFEFMGELKLRETLSLDEGEEAAQLWNILLDILDQLVTVAGDSPVTSEQFAQLLSVMFDEADIGHIPTSIDEVVIGNAMTLRAGRCKNVYILGANDGVFPQNVSDDGVFTDSERIALETVGVTLSSGTDERASDELFYFCRAVCCASDNASIFYHTADTAGRAVRPSAACERIRTLFPALKPVIFAAAAPLDCIYSPEASFEYTAVCRSTPLGDALKSVYYTLGGWSKRLEALDRPFIETENTLSPDIAQKLFGGDLALTQSRLESFATCEFSYYCRYILRLQERKRAEFRQIDIGSFTHRVLERCLSALRTEEGIRTDLDDDELEALVDGVIDEYLNSVAGYSVKRTNRILQLFRRLRRTSLLLLKSLQNEFRQSGFQPVFFELPIKFGDPEAVTPLSVPLADGSSAYIFGKVDRVDIYKSGGKIYVRVVDYKTGIKKFSLSDVELGLDLQMLLYLFAIWRNPSASFLKRAGGEGEIVPAGVLYMSVRAPEIEVTPDMDGNNVREEAENSLSRDGLLIDDENILRAMDSQLSGRYIPVKLKKDGSFTASSPVQSLEEFGLLLRKVETTVSRISSELKGGHADAKPLTRPGTDICRYCPNKPICRSAKN